MLLLRKVLMSACSHSFFPDAKYAGLAAQLWPLRFAPRDHSNQLQEGCLHANPFCFVCAFVYFKVIRGSENAVGDIKHSMSLSTRVRMPAPPLPPIRLLKENILYARRL